jgi:DNA-binding response OmpR family regulator
MIEDTSGGGKNGKLFTDTERKILGILADGLPHTRPELHACLPDELSSLTTIQFHISRIRKKLRPFGQDIVCELNNGIKYRRVQLLVPAADGKR